MFANSSQGSGMRRENDPMRAPNFLQPLEDFHEAFPVINIRRTMQSEQDVSTAFQAEPLDDRRKVRLGFILPQRVNHSAAHEENALARNTFHPQISQPAPLAHEQEI